jgi:hypothetical protein
MNKASVIVAVAHSARGVACAVQICEHADSRRRVQYVAKLLCTCILQSNAIHQRKVVQNIATPTQCVIKRSVTVASMFKLLKVVSSSMYSDQQQSSSSVVLISSC